MPPSNSETRYPTIKPALKYRPDINIGPPNPKFKPLAQNKFWDRQQATLIPFKRTVPQTAPISPLSDIRIEGEVYYANGESNY